MVLAKSSGPQKGWRKLVYLTFLTDGWDGWGSSTEGFHDLFSCRRKIVVASCKGTICWGRTQQSDVPTSNTVCSLLQLLFQTPNSKSGRNFSLVFFLSANFIFIYIFRSKLCCVLVISTSYHRLLSKENLEYKNCPFFCVLGHAESQ